MKLGDSPPQEDKNEDDKQKRGGKNKNKDQQDLSRFLPALTKMFLQSSEHIRALGAMTFEVFLVPAERQAVIETKKHTKNCSNLVTETKNQKRRPDEARTPHLAVWEGFLAGIQVDLVTNAQVRELPQANRVFEHFCPNSASRFPSSRP